MENHLFPHDSYHTPKQHIPFLNRKFPSLIFWIKILLIVWRSYRLAKKNKYNTKAWIQSSFNSLKALESVGVKFVIENLGILRALNQPCVFIGNHMSTLETFVLPCIIAPFCDVTFIVKKALIEYPIFKYVMRSRNPIVVGRTNPKDDFKIVLEDGKKLLAGNTSIIVFPQTTRTISFNQQQFNSIGIKLAKHANIPVMPVALRSDAWGNGKLIKDLPKINPKKTVHFCFGDLIHIQGAGKKEHEQVMTFISNKLAMWETIKKQ